MSRSLITIEQKENRCVTAFITSKRQNVIHNSPLRTVLGTTSRFQVCSSVIQCLIFGKDNVKVSEYLHIVSYESRPPFSLYTCVKLFRAISKWPCSSQCIKTAECTELGQNRRESLVPCNSQEMLILTGAYFSLIYIPFSGKGIWWHIRGIYTVAAICWI